jgi:hypothetical protein
MVSTPAEAVRTRIVELLRGAGVPRVDVQAGLGEADALGHGGFVIHTEYGGVKLYLPGDILDAYEHDHGARRSVEEAVAGIVQLLRRP